MNTKKRVRIVNIPTNMKNTYSQNNYIRSNIPELRNTMRKGRRAVSIAKARAHLEKRNINLNNMMEIPTLSGDAIKILTRALYNIKNNKSKRRRNVLNRMSMNNILRNINSERRRELASN